MNNRRQWLLVVIVLSIPVTAIAGEGKKYFEGDLRSYLESQHFTCLQLDKLNSGYLATSVRVNSKQIYLIVDTGAPNTHFDIYRTQSLKLPWTELNGFSGGATQVCDVNTIEIGSCRVGKIRICADDVSELNVALEAYGDPKIDGVLGGDVLGLLKAVIDCENCRLYLKPIAPPVKPPLRLVDLPIQESKSTVSVEAMPSRFRRLRWIGNIRAK